MAATKKEYKPKNDRDDEQPEFIFSTTSTALLVGIAKGEIDIQKRALIELMNRGIGKDGRWVGFMPAAREWSEEPEQKVDMTEIAKEKLGIETLVSRKRDALDFHELPVWMIEEALLAAYKLGRESK